MDIDDVLIRAAWKRRRTVWSQDPLTEDSEDDSNVGNGLPLRSENKQTNDEKSTEPSLFRDEPRFPAAFEPGRGDPELRSSSGCWDCISMISLMLPMTGTGQSDKPDSSSEGRRNFTISSANLISHCLFEAWPTAEPTAWPRVSSNANCDKVAMMACCRVFLDNFVDKYRSI